MTGPEVENDRCSEQQWRPVTRSRTYELVIERIEERILSGALGVGERLPPERELASLLGVSRAAVREALRVLEAQGVLRMSVGTGPDSGTTVAALPSRALTRLLRLHVALANFPMANVVEARVMLERESAYRAATRAGPEHSAELRRLVVDMDVADDRTAFNELDTRFHVAIAEAAGNRLVADMTTAIRESLRGPLLTAFEALGDEWPEVVAGLRADHHAILAAVENGDGTRAGQRMEQHIRDFHQRVSAQTGQSPAGGFSRPATWRGTTPPD